MIVAPSSPDSELLIVSRNRAPNDDVQNEGLDIMYAQGSNLPHDPPLLTARPQPPYAVPCSRQQAFPRAGREPAEGAGCGHGDRSLGHVRNIPGASHAPLVPS